MSDLADDDDYFVCMNATLKEQVGFCLLGGFGITAEINHAFYDRFGGNPFEGPLQPGEEPAF